MYLGVGVIKLLSHDVKVIIRILSCHEQQQLKSHISLLNIKILWYEKKHPASYNRFTISDVRRNKCLRAYLKVCQSTVQTITFQKLKQLFVAHLLTNLRLIRGEASILCTLCHRSQQKKRVSRKHTGEWIKRIGADTSNEGRTEIIEKRKAKTKSRQLLWFWEYDSRFVSQFTMSWSFKTFDTKADCLNTNQWQESPAWCSVVGSILLWGEFFP